jgi:hypothetical protein
MKGLVRYSLVASIGLGLIGPATAQGTVVTVGNPLTATFSPNSVGAPPATLANFVLPPGANVTSPVTGTIVRWRITQATGGPFRLRVLAPQGGTTYTGVAASEPRSPLGTETQSFTTNLPISAGQLIGLDLTTASDQIGVASTIGSGAMYGTWSPALTDGETRPLTFFGTSDTEIGFNADVATIPSNADTLGKVKLNKHKGTATLAVRVPGPGTLSLTGKNVKPQRPAREATASQAVTAAGTVKLFVKAKGKAKKKLNKTGKAKVKVTVTYTPTGDLPGVPNTETKHLKLVKKLG